MINFRFHIVSLTAVLLALGIGLVLGTTFLDDATVSTLRNRLDGLESDLDDAQQRNAQQSDRLDSFQRETAALNEQLGDRLFAGQLTDVPVLVIAPRGIDEDTVDRTRLALRQADADLLGTWWFTDRFTLDDEGEVTDLGDALELSTDDVDRLRANLAGQLGDVLFAASDQSDRGANALEGAASASQGVQGIFGGPGQTGPAEPAVLARLREAGFVEYDMPEGAEDDVIRLPASGLRIVVVSGPDAAVPPNEILLPILIDLASSGPVPAVAVEPSLVLRTVGDTGETEPQPSLVVEIREDDDLVDRVSTVDDIDRVSGQVATVLAVADAVPGQPTIGHYGLGDGTELLPPPPEEGG